MTINKGIPALGQPSRETMRDQIYSELRDALIAGKFLPGQVVTLNSIAQAMGTSHMPVREAIRQLLAEGALEAAPNRTIKVPVMTEARFSDLTAMRLLVEGEATRLAAAFCTPADCKRLDGITDKMIAAARDNQHTVYLALNMSFHFTLYARARSPLMMTTIESFWVKAGPIIRTTLGDIAFDLSQKNHRAATAALERRDGEAAAQAIHQDISDAARQISKSCFHTGQDADDCGKSILEM